MYMFGKGVAQDVTEALKLFVLDAEELCDSPYFPEMSEYSSLHHIRDFYLEIEDCVEAIKWYVIFTSSSPHVQFR
jgi:hypothetical protein